MVRLNLVEGVAIEILGGLTPTENVGVFKLSGIVELKFISPVSERKPLGGVGDPVYGGGARVHVSWFVPRTENGGSYDDHDYLVGYDQQGESLQVTGKEVSFAADPESMAAFNMKLQGFMKKAYNGKLIVTITIGMITTTIVLLK